MGRRVPLTSKVVRGLAAMKSACDADPLEVLLASDGDMPLSDDQRRVLSDYDAAVKWIEDQQRRRETKATGASHE